MSDIVVWPESILDIAMWVRYKMTLFIHDQTQLLYHFQDNKNRFMNLVYTI